MWNCSKCNESINDSHEICWNCGTSKDGKEDPSFTKENEERIMPEDAKTETISNDNSKTQSPELMRIASVIILVVISPLTIFFYIDHNTLQGGVIGFEIALLFSSSMIALACMPKTNSAKEGLATCLFGFVWLFSAGYLLFNISSIFKHGEGLGTVFTIAVTIIAGALISLAVTYLKTSKKE